MADTATQSAPAPSGVSRPATTDATVTLPEVRPHAPGAPGAPDGRPDTGRPDTGRPADPPLSPAVPSAPANGGSEAPSRRRGRSGPFSGITLGLPGRRGPRSEGGGRGGRRFPLRPGEGGDGVDLRNTWQVVAGALLVPLGVVFILMSWYGAAHTPYVQQQIPYLVSGSFAGLGCIVLGGLLYWAHWLYRIYDQADLHHQEQIDALHQTLRVIAERLDGSGSGPGTGESAGAQATGAGAPRAAAHEHGVADAPGSEAGFVASDGGSYFHLPACPVVAHHAEGMRAVGGDALGTMEPCRICRPTEAGDRVHAEDGDGHAPGGRP